MIGMPVGEENGVEGTRVKLMLGERAAAGLACIHEELVATGGSGGQEDEEG